MNKQEVLEELETTSTQFFHVATSTGVEANNKTLSTGVFAGLGIAKSVLTKLEEPQKVKVPTFVAEYFNYCIVNERTLAEALSGLDRDFKIPDFLYPAIKWLEDSINQNIFAQAWLYGYEVEEEPKWVVKVGNLYFCGWEDTTAQFVMNTVLGEDESIIKYKNEGTASSVAKNLGGTVKKV